MKTLKKAKTKVQKQSEYVKGLEILLASKEKQLKFFLETLKAVSKEAQSGHFTSTGVGVLGELPQLVREMVEHYEGDIAALSKDLEVTKAILAEVRASKAEWLKHFGVKNDTPADYSAYFPMWKSKT